MACSDREPAGAETEHGVSAECRRIAWCVRRETDPEKDNIELVVPMGLGAGTRSCAEVSTVGTALEGYVPLLNRYKDVHTALYDTHEGTLLMNFARYNIYTLIY
jgi:hypothetical protein